MKASKTETLGLCEETQSVCLSSGVANTEGSAKNKKPTGSSSKKVCNVKTVFLLLSRVLHLCSFWPLPSLQTH